MRNKFPAPCVACGTRVPAQRGTLEKRDGAWVVRCDACAAAPAEVAAVEAVVTERVAAAAGETYTLLSGHAASAHQVAIFEDARYGRGSRIIKAVAGAGKTTSIKNMLRYVDPRQSVLLLAFNVKAAVALKEATKELASAPGSHGYRNVEAKTFNGLGHGAVLRKLLSLGVAKEAVRVDDGKLRALLRERLGATEEGQETLRTYGRFARALVGYAKGEGIGALTPDTECAWYSLVEHHGLYLEDEAADPAVGVALARRLMGWSNEAAEKGWIDYDDQMYLVVKWKLRLWRHALVVADEAQDTNPVGRALLRLSLLENGRLFAVGDPKQSIYGFRGATSDAMDRIAAEFRTRELPLTVSYRCARAVVERAQTWVPYIEPAASAPEGVVRDEVPLHEALTALSDDDAVLCRQTAPLVSVAYGLIARGRPARILGREIGEGLVALVESMKARGIDRLREKLAAFAEREAARFTAKGDEGRAEAVEDRVACVTTIIDALPETERTVPALIRRIEALFADNGGRALTMATVHKSKGLEWDRVAILRPELMPSRAARQEWQYEQEVNLMYVAATRAKQELLYVRDEDMELDAPKGRAA